MLKYYTQGAQPKITIIGGHHASALPEQSLTDAFAGKTPLIDISVAGYGEQTLYEILNDGNDVANITYFGADGRIKRTRHEKREPPMFSPDWSVFPEFVNGEGFYKNIDYININFSFGCPNRCSYCGSLKPERITRKAEEVAEEARHNLEKYRHFKGIGIADDNFFFNLKDAEELFEAFKAQGIDDIHLTMGIDPSVLSGNLSSITELLNKYDFKYDISFSLEFTDDVHMERWNRRFLGKTRNHKTEKKAVTKFIKNSDINKFNFAINYVTPCPDDTIEDVYGVCREAKDMIPLRKKRVNTIYLFSLHPYPGTASYNYVNNKNMWKKHDDFKGLKFPKWEFFREQFLTPYVLEKRIENAYSKVNKILDEENAERDLRNMIFCELFCSMFKQGVI